ncbi:MAG TPA: VIT1/CCC1 transporter family protein [Anaerolineaceae bacterium]|nr:VIT1/CCC1 transporter family protein [Anaerolineaceae bacterium]
MTGQEVQQYLANWNDERNSSTIYLALTEVEKDPRIAEVYRRMAAVELQHAEKWAEEIKAAGQEVPEFYPTVRTRILIWLARRFGPNLILNNIQTMEKDGASGYSRQPQAQGMVADEASHGRILGMISRTIRGGMSGGFLAQMEGRHRSTGGGNALRAAVLGANDGLVSNLSLVMGVAGADLASRSILITGFAGLLAGAISMALGEWLSVQSSRELYENQIKIEKAEIEHAPTEEAEELALIYEARGLSSAQAHQLSTQIMANPEGALDTLAREELGMDPEELGGSAWQAALTSFFLFALGAIIPVIPYTFLTGTTAVLVSILFSTIGLFTLGAVTTLFTGQKVLFSGMRMVTFGLLAAGITFGIGRLIGTSIGG